MAEITIGDNHRELVARWQHILEWLQGEQSRLDSERFYIIQKGAAIQQEMLYWLHNVYNTPLDGAGVTVDSARGVIVTPDEDPKAEPQPATDSPPE